MSDRRTPMSVAVQVVTVVGLLLLASVGAAQSPTMQEKAPPAPGVEQKAQAPRTSVAIPIPAIVAQAEAVTKLWRDLEALAVPGPEIEAIQARLLEVSVRLGPELASTIETLKQTPPLPILDRLQQSWQASRLDGSLRPVGRDPKRAERRRVRGPAEGGAGDPVPPARGAPAAGVRSKAITVERVG